MLDGLDGGVDGLVLGAAAVGAAGGATVPSRNDERLRRETALPVTIAHDPLT